MNPDCLSLPVCSLLVWHPNVCDHSSKYVMPESGSDSDPQPVHAKQWSRYPCSQYQPIQRFERIRVLVSLSARRKTRCSGTFITAKKEILVRINKLYGENFIESIYSCNAFLIWIHTNTGAQSALTLSHTHTHAMYGYIEKYLTRLVSELFKKHLNKMKSNKIKWKSARTVHTYTACRTYQHIDTTTLCE